MKSYQSCLQELEGGLDLKSAPIFLKHKFKAKSYLAFLGIIAVSFFTSQTAVAEDFGRTSATGTWSDGGWVGSAGGTAPSASDKVYIGNTSAVAGSVEPAAVNLGSSIAVQDLALGNSQSGTLDILSKGALSASSVSVRNGLLNVQSGGNLSANNLTVSGGESVATLNGSSSINTINIHNAASFNANSALDTTYMNVASKGAVKFNANSNFKEIFAGSGSALTINADTVAKTIYVHGSTLNLKAGGVTGSLDLQKLDGVASQVNQKGGHVSLRNLAISGGTNMTLGARDSVSNSVSLKDGATLNVDSEQDMSFRVLLDKSALNLNANLKVHQFSVTGAGSVINRGHAASLDIGILMLNDNVNYDYDGIDNIRGTVSALNGSAFTADSALKLTGDLRVEKGVVTLNATGNIAGYINVFDESVLNVNAAVNVGNSLFVGGKSTLNVNANMKSGFAYVSGNSTWNLNAGTFTSDRLSLSSALKINRNGGHLALLDLRLDNNSSLTLGAGDSASHLVQIYSGSTLNIDSVQNLDSILDISGKSTLNLNADIAAIRTDIEDSTLNLNAGTLTGSLIVAENNVESQVQVNRNGGYVNLENLTVRGNADMTLVAGDVVSNTVSLSTGAALNAFIDLEIGNVDLASSSVFSFTQEFGKTDGLSIDRLAIDSTSKLDLWFDSGQVTGLDWALRLTGKQELDLQLFLDNGQISFSGGTAPVGIVYDVASYGDYTYLGYVSAVPLPGAFPLMIFGISALGFFSRKKSVK